MKPFTRHTGVVVPLDRVNVDTDQIIPKQFLKRVERTGFGQVLFFDWRYREDGSEDPTFELNQPEFRDGSILLARRNFGCGSSREHAVWALSDHGFRVLIAPSFADIFYNNCFKNGLLPVTLPAEAVDRLFEAVRTEPGFGLTVDLEACRVASAPSGGGEPSGGGKLEFGFELDPFRREMLLQGLDEIGLALKLEEQIARYEAARPPWQAGDTVRMGG